MEWMNSTIRVPFACGTKVFTRLAKGTGYRKEQKRKKEKKKVDKKFIIYKMDWKGENGIYAATSFVYVPQ